MKGATRARGKETAVEKESEKEVNRQPSKEVKLEELLWVKLPKSSWWPGQVVDEATVSNAIKPKRKQSSGDVLVRLYGSYEYTYVNVMKSQAEFRNVLAENNFNHKDILKKTLDMEVHSLNSRRSRGQPSESKGKVDMEASQDGLSEQNISRNIQGEKPGTSRREKGKQIAGKKTNESRPQTPDTKGKNKRQKLDVLHDDVKPSTPKSPNTVSSRSPARRTKVMQSLGLIAPSGSPFRSELISPSRAVC